MTYSGFTLLTNSRVKKNIIKWKKKKSEDQIKA